MNHQLIGTIAALGSAASWAVGAILFKTLGERLAPAPMTLAKGLVSSIILGCALIPLGYQRIDSIHLALLVGSGLLGITFGDICFFAALRNLSAYLAVLYFMLGQALTVVLAIFFLSETVTNIELGGIGFTLLGLSIVLWSQSTLEQAPGTSNLKGILFGLISMLCMSSSTLIAKQALVATPSLQATFIRMLAGAFGAFLVSAASRQSLNFYRPFASVKFSLQFLIAVSVVTFGGFWLSMVSIKYLDVAIANTLNSTEPLFALPLAMMFLKEKVNWRILLGSLITLGGIVLLNADWLTIGFVYE